MTAKSVATDMKAGYRTPFVYIYLDQDGIESLYAQTADRIEVESLKGSEIERAGKARANVGLGPALKGIVGNRS